MNKSLFSDAKRNFDKLLETGGQHPGVMADFAWLLAAAPVESIRDPQRASEAVTEAMTSQQGPQWLAWRAKAALLAGQGRWDDAINALDRAANQAPLVLADELERQRKQYEARENYWIERKKSP
jgi:tetratricopeptide (TPR) repeat protein